MALNDRHKLFCQEYVANGYKGKDAYKVVYPNANEDTAKSNASRLLSRDDIKEHIREIQKDRFEALNISAERIGEELAKMAFADFDENNTANSKTKALELLAKQLGLYTTKVDANVESKNVISIVIDDKEGEEE